MESHSNYRWHRSVEISLENHWKSLDKHWNAWEIIGNYGKSLGNLLKELNSGGSHHPSMVVGAKTQKWKSM